MKHELLKILDEMRKDGQMPRPETLAARLSELSLPISATELPTLITEILRALGAHAGHVYVPQMLTRAISKILEGRSAEVVCDPWAGLGVLLATAQETIHSTKSLAFTRNAGEFELGRILVSTPEWKLGDPLLSLDSLQTEIDVVVSILPWGEKSDRSITLTWVSPIITDTFIKRGKIEGNVKGGTHDITQEIQHGV